MSLTVTSDLDPGSWDAFVEASPRATPYHRHAWKGVLQESFRHPAHYLAALESSGRVAGVLPLVHLKSRLFGNFLVSLPFVNYGGLLCATAEAERALLGAAERLREQCGAGHVELRHLDWAVAGLPAREHKVTMILPLTGDPQTQWTGFNAKLRNQVRKAEKNGLGCRTGGAELLDDFYRVFARNMRDLGTPVYAKDFFRNVLAGFPGSSRVFAVSRQGETVGAGIVSWYRGTMEMPWASSISDFKQFCPNNLLYWEAIRFAIANGCRAFDFGRSTPNEGTFNFKKQWGATPVQLHWQYLLAADGAPPELNPKNPKFQAAIGVWKRLPVGLTRLFGPGIVRNIP
jgi:FemAB-related protein (PEP-CTERM system-associated)